VAPVHPASVSLLGKSGELIDPGGGNGGSGIVIIRYPINQ